MCIRDRGYLAGGAEVYPLADALQDAYLALLDLTRAKAACNDGTAAVSYTHL